MGGLFGHVAFAVALTASGFVVGRRLIARLPTASIAEETAFATAIGLGVIAHLVLALGLVGLLTRGPVLGACGVLVVGCALPWRAVRRARPTWAALALVGACALLGLLALYPSTAWDANSYHLPAAAWFVDQHRVTPRWPLRYAAFPAANEALFALALLLGDDASAQLVQAIFGAVTALALYAAGRRRSERAGAWAAALWLASPLVLRLGATGYVDVGLAAFGTSSVLALDRFAEERRSAWMIVAAALAGFAASSKYLGLFFVGVAGLHLAWRSARAQLPWRAAGTAAAVLLVVGAPWYAYIAWQTGTPLFPFVGAHDGWSAADLAAQLTDLRSHGTGTSLGAALALPFRLAFAQRAFFPEEPVSPLLWVGLVPVAWVARRDAAVRGWACVVAAAVALWFCGSQMYRYLVPVLPLLALAVGVSLAELLSPRQRLAAPAIALALAAQGLVWSVERLHQWGAPPLTDEARDAWLSARLPAYRAVRFAARAAAGARVYQVELEDYVRYAGRDVVGDWFGPWRYARLVDRMYDPNAFVAELSASGAHWLVAARPPWRGDLYVPAHPRLALRYADASAVVYELLPP